MTDGNGISAHERTDGGDEWLTPPYILEALGHFDLDPCAPESHNRPWPMADSHFTKEDDGLVQEWFGRVWLNPPYGRETHKWVRKLAEHGNGIALIFARTETGTWFPWIWRKADALLFLDSRISFYRTDGARSSSNAGAPSTLVAYGQHNATSLLCSGLSGMFVPLHDAARVREAKPLFRGGPCGTS